MDKRLFLPVGFDLVIPCATRALVLCFSLLLSTSEDVFSLAHRREKARAICFFFVNSTQALFAPNAMCPMIRSQCYVPLLEACARAIRARYEI